MVLFGAAGVLGLPGCQTEADDGTAYKEVGEMRVFDELRPANEVLPQTGTALLPVLGETATPAPVECGVAASRRHAQVGELDVEN